MAPARRRPGPFVLPVVPTLNVMGIGTIRVIRLRFFAPQNPKSPPSEGADLLEVDGLGAPSPRPFCSVVGTNGRCLAWS